MRNTMALFQPARAASVCAAALIGAGAPAETIPIVNPGFETVSRALAGGAQSNGIGGAGTPVGTRSMFPFGNGVVDWSDPVTVSGWRTWLPPFGSENGVLAGVLRPTEIGGEPFITGIEGDYALSVQAALVGQATSAILQPNTTYTLSFLGGISQFDSEYFLSVTLTAIDDGVPLPVEGQAGVTRLALGAFFPPSNVPDGIMRRYEFSYTSPETLPGPLVGARVGITVFGSDGLPRVIYDDFQLTAVAAIPSDINGDRIVDTADLGILIGQFATAGPEADLNGDGIVDTADLGILIGTFGQTSP